MEETAVREDEFEPTKEPEDGQEQQDDSTTIEPADDSNWLDQKKELNAQRAARFGVPVNQESSTEVQVSFQQCTNYLDPEKVKRKVYDNPFRNQTNATGNGINFLSEVGLSSP